MHLTVSPVADLLLSSQSAAEVGLSRQSPAALTRLTTGQSGPNSCTCTQTDACSRSAKCTFDGFRFKISELELLQLMYLA